LVVVDLISVRLTYRPLSSGFDLLTYAELDISTGSAGSPLFIAVGFAYCLLLK